MSRAAALWRQFEAAPDSVRQVAAERLEKLQAVEQLVDGGMKRNQAIAQIAAESSTSRATLYRWSRLVANHHRSDWLAALLPAYSGSDKTAEIDPAAWDMFRADYLRPEAPAAAACYDRLKRAAKVHGWQLASARTFYRRIEEIPRPVRLLAREGANALKAAYPAQERDRSVFDALQAVNADGHRFDNFARWPDGTVGRPVMIAWQDLYSGKILSHRVDRTEHTDLIRLAFGDLIERWGIPELAYLDNGRGFASKWLTGGQPTRYRFKIRDEDPLGIITQMGVRVSWTTPYHGQAKPIERSFRDLCEYVAKHPALAGSYTGNKPGAKPENYGSRAVPIEQFLEIVQQEIDAHNARAGRRTKICRGRSFDQVFDESYRTVAVRRATAEQRRLWLLAAEGVSASRADGSVRLDGNRYWCEQLAEFAGQRVVVRFDPDQLHESVYCYTTDGRAIGEAACIQAAGFNDTTAAREHARARKQWMRAQRDQLAAERRMNALAAAQKLPKPEQPEAPKPTVLRPAFRGGGALPKTDPFADELPDRSDEEREANFSRTIDDLWEQRQRRDAL